MLEKGPGSPEFNAFFGTLFISSRRVIYEKIMQFFFAF